MTDLTDDELGALEAEHLRLDLMFMRDRPGEVRRLIAEVRRWRDKAADEAGLARLTAEIRAVGSPDGEENQ